MDKSYKNRFENAMTAIKNAQNDANIIANSVLDEMPITNIDVEHNMLYCTSDIYDNICEIIEIVKDDEGVCVVTEYGEYIEIRDLDDKYYNDVILYIIDHC